MLHLAGAPSGDRYRLTLSVLSEAGEPLLKASVEVPKESVRGNVALVNNFAQNLNDTLGIVFAILL